MISGAGIHVAKPGPARRNRSRAYQRAYQGLLAEAGLHRMLAQGFSYPDQSTIEFVRTTALDLISATARGELPRLLQAPLRALLRAWRRAGEGELREEHSRLFLGNGLVPLREGGYGGGSRFAGQPVDIADISGFYLAFGFDVTEGSPVPPDHLGAELEFLSLLLLKKAQRLRKGSVLEVRTVDRARRLFLNDHLGRWADALAKALRDASSAPPYATLGELLRATIALECRELHIKPLAAGRSVLEDQVLADTFVCPLAELERPARAGGPR
jgi:TorA maturation chaperone TorD